jgi:hypothetical protein
LSLAKKSTAKAKDTTSVEDAPVVNQESSLASKKETKNMSEGKSIIEYSEDISNAEAPAPLPPGDYPAEIRGAEIKTSQKGNEYVAVTFFIAPESYPADFTEGDADGMTLSYNRIVVDDSPRGRHRMRKFCEAIGASTSAKLDVNDWIGNTAVVSVAQSEYEGETRAEIAKVIAA